MSSIDASIEDLVQTIDNVHLSNGSTSATNTVSEKKPSKRLRGNKNKNKDPSKTNNGTSTASVAIVVATAANAEEKGKRRQTTPVDGPTADQKAKPAKKRKPKAKKEKKEAMVPLAMVGETAAAAAPVNADSDGQPKAAKKRKPRKPKKKVNASGADAAPIPTEASADAPKTETKPTTPKLDFDALLKQLTKDDLIDFETLKAKIESLGLTVSKSLMKNITLQKDYHKCCKCERAYDTEDELAIHIKSSKHKYGNVEYRQNRRDLLRRAKEKLGVTIGGVSIPDVDITEKKQLTRDEKAAFNALLKNDELLSPALQGTLYNLLYTGICLRKLGEKVEYDA